VVSSSGTQTSASVRRIPFLLSVASIAGVVELTGGAWDINWHIVQRPETFLTPPHIVLYSGALLLLLTTLAMVIFTRSGLRGKVARTFGLIAVGVLIQLGAGGFDNWWHGTFGVDNSFSPPHILLISGMVVATFGIVLSFRTLRTTFEPNTEPSLLWIPHAISFVALNFSVWGLFWVLSYPGFTKDALLSGIWQRVIVSGAYTFLVPFIAIMSAIVVGRRGSATITFLVGGISVQAVNLFMDRFSLEALIFFPIFVLPGILTDILHPRSLARSLLAGLILSGYGFFPGDIVASMTGDPFVQWLLFLPVFGVSGLVAGLFGYLASLKVNTWAGNMSPTSHNYTKDRMIVG